MSKEVKGSINGSIRTTALFWQQTGWASHLFPPRPRTEIGEQPKPTSAVTSERIIPSNPKIAAGPLAEAYPRVEGQV